MEYEKDTKYIYQSLKHTRFSHNFFILHFNFYARN